MAERVLCRVTDTERKIQSPLKFIHCFFELCTPSKPDWLKFNY